MHKKLDRQNKEQPEKKSKNTHQFYSHSYHDL